MATKAQELANPQGCLALASDDEPIFVLRANDVLASKMVDEWAAEYVFTKSVTGTVMTEKQKAKYREAVELADQMRLWRTAKGLLP